MGWMKIGCEKMMEKNKEEEDAAFKEEEEVAFGEGWRVEGGGRL